MRTETLAKKEVKKLREQASSSGSKEVQYIQAFEKAFTTEIYDSRDQKNVISEISVAIDQWGHGNSTEKVTDLDLA